VLAGGGRKNHRQSARTGRYRSHEFHVAIASRTGAARAFAVRRGKYRPATLSQRLNHAPKPCKPREACARAGATSKGSPDGPFSRPDPASAPAYFSDKNRGRTAGKQPRG